MKKTLLYLFLLLPFVPLSAQDYDVSNLQKQLVVVSSDSSKIEISIKLITAYASIDLDSSIFYFENAIQLAKKINNPQKIIKIQKILIDNLMDKGVYTKAKVFIDEGLALGHQLENDSIICSHLILLVAWHWEMSNVKQSFEVMNDALIYADKAKSLQYKAMIFISYGIFYGEQNETKKEREYFQKSLQIFIETKDTINQVILLQNLADSYFNAKDFSTALELINQAIELIKISNKGGIIHKHVLAFKGNILYNLGETDLGFSILDSALIMATTDNNSRLIVLINNEKSKWLLDAQKYDEAIYAANIGVEICKKTSYLHQLPELCNTISQSYKAKNNFEAALLWMGEKNQAEAEIKNRQQQKELILLQAKHDLQQKEIENQILLLKNKNQFFLITLLATLALIISFFIYYFSKKKQKKKLELFRQRIAADLHDDVGSNLNSISRIAKGLKSNNTPKDIDNGIDRLVKKSNMAIQNVVDVIWALDQEESTLEDLIEKMEVSLDGVRSTNKNVEIQFVKKNISKNTFLTLKAKHHLLMIFKESINNIQKHTNSSLITIELDNIDQKLNMNIINHFQSKKENYNSTGKGIINIRRRIKDLGGTIDIKDTKDEFKIKIRLDKIS